LRHLFGHRWLEILPGLALVLAYGTFTHPFRAWSCAHPMEPVKEATLAMRGTLDPNDPLHNDQLTGVLLSLDDYYDPRAKLIENPEDFVKLLQTSDQQRKPLSIMAHHLGRSPLKFHNCGDFSTSRVCLPTTSTFEAWIKPTIAWSHVISPVASKVLISPLSSAEGQASPMRMSRR
jgi:hypothetical protein